MNTIARLFILQAICCVFAAVISIGGVIDGILGVLKMERDAVRERKKVKKVKRIDEHRGFQDCH